jgi:hypothetical protein
VSDLGRKSFVNCPKDRNGFEKGQKIGSFGKKNKKYKNVVFILIGEK